MRFLTQSGLELDDLVTRIGEPDLLAGVLDFLLTDDALLTGFAASEGVNAARIHAARRALPWMIRRRSRRLSGGMKGATPWRILEP